MRRHHILAATACLAVLATSGCSAANHEDTLWGTGCAALSAGIAAQGAQRQAQIAVLDGIVRNTGLPKDQQTWAGKSVTLLRYQDVRRAPKALRQAAGAPCKQHGHAVEALG